MERVHLLQEEIRDHMISRNIDGELLDVVCDVVCVNSSVLVDEGALVGAASVRALRCPSVPHRRTDGPV
jgi:hypothetical protein